MSSVNFNFKSLISNFKFNATDNSLFAIPVPIHFSRQKLKKNQKVTDKLSEKLNITDILSKYPQYPQYLKNTKTIATKGGNRFG